MHDPERGDGRRGNAPTADQTRATKSSRNATRGRGPWVVRVDDVATSADSLASALRGRDTAIRFAEAMLTYLRTGVAP